MKIKKVSHIFLLLTFMSLFFACKEDEIKPDDKDLEEEEILDENEEPSDTIRINESSVFLVENFKLSFAQIFDGEERWTYEFLHHLDGENIVSTDQNQTTIGEFGEQRFEYIHESDENGVIISSVKKGERLDFTYEYQYNEIGLISSVETYIETSLLRTTNFSYNEDYLLILSDHIGANEDVESFTEEFTYNTEGQVSSYHYKYENGSEESDYREFQINEYTYESGKVIEIHTEENYYSEPKIYTRAFEYDNEGRIIKVTNTSEGILNEYETFVFRTDEFENYEYLSNDILSLSRIYTFKREQLGFVLYNYEDEVFQHALKNIYIDENESKRIYFLTGSINNLQEWGYAEREINDDYQTIRREIFNLQGSRLLSINDNDEIFNDNGEPMEKSSITEAWIIGLLENEFHIY